MTRRSPLAALVVLAALLLLAASGCSTQQQDDINDLRDYAHDESIPLAERCAVMRNMLANENENTHTRAAAAQMLGEMKDPQAVESMFLLLGDGGLGRVTDSEMLRLESVIALGKFASAAIYRKTFLLLYDTHKEPSARVRRQFVQSFSNVPVGAGTSGEVLLELLRQARNIREDEGIIWRATLELRRICNRPDLDSGDVEKWEKQLRDMRGP